jgi:hypothetical protein
MTGRLHQLIQLDQQIHCLMILIPTPDKLLIKKPFDFLSLTFTNSEYVSFHRQISYLFKLITFFRIYTIVNNNDIKYYRLEKIECLGLGLRKLVLFFY